MGFAGLIGAASVASQPLLPTSYGSDAAYYEALLVGVQPRIILPIHWVDLFRPLSKPVRPYWKPPRLAFPPLERVDLTEFRKLIEHIAPETKVFLPEIFRLYDLNECL